MPENFLKMLAVGAFVLLALAGAGYAFQYKRFVDKTYPMRTFSVDGKGEIDTVPDLASFSATVVTEGGTNVAEVQTANTEKMNKINTFLKEQGVDAKDLKTSNYNLSPRYSSNPCVGNVCPQPEINGYTVSQSLDVKVRDSAKIGDLLSGVVQNGANSVSGVRFVVDDDTDSKNAARKDAIAEAKEKAKSIAKAGGFRLGKIVSLYESAGPVTPYAYGMGGDMEMSAMKTAVAPAIEPGTNETEVQVTITYEIKD